MLFCWRTIYGCDIFDGSSSSQYHRISFTAILLGIPGANSAAATMVDGFPLAQQGRAGYAISAAVTTSTVNGLIWGCLVFLLLPWYTNLIMILGIPELWAFTVLALATVGFLSNQYWFRSILAIAFGIFIGMVGRISHFRCTILVLFRRWYTNNARCSWFVRGARINMGC